MTDDKNDLKNSEKLPTDNVIKKKRNMIKKAKIRTKENSSQRNKIKQDDLVKWSIFVQEETKVAVGKAIEKAGTTVTEWVDSRLRDAATAELTKKPQLPVKPEDLVKDVMEQFAERIKTDQSAAIQAQNDLIQQQGQQIAALAETIKNSQPRSLTERLFGKSRKD